jgi:hypothetical protein
VGFLDKVKEQATVAAGAAKEAAQKGQAKLDDMQAKKAADAKLRDLGAVVYAQQTGRGGPNADEDAKRIVVSLQAHEAEHGPIDLQTESSSGSAAD